METHEKGWVNNELQEYVDSDENIQVKDGKLVINPVKKVAETENKDAGNLLKNQIFSEEMEGWTQTIANWVEQMDQRMLQQRQLMVRSSIVLKTQEHRTGMSS